MDISTRHPRYDEMSVLRYIWSAVFNDGDEAAYFDYYFDPKLCVVAIRNGTPVSAGYLLPAGNIICGAATVPCAMIYGVATLPEYRKLGLGAAVTRELLSVGYAAGFPAISLCPSNDSLFEFYSARAPFREWFYVHERKLEKELVKNSHVKPYEVLSNDYGHLRESLLASIPHIQADERALIYQGLLCREFGGGLLRIDTPGGISCAIVEGEQNGAVLVKELLAPDGFEDDAISSIAAAFPSSAFIVRTPARYRNYQSRAHSSQPVIYNYQPGRSPMPEQNLNKIFPDHHEVNPGFIVRRFGMISGPDTLFNNMAAHTAMPWFGLAFD